MGTSTDVLEAAQLAWRNSARCVGRKPWRSLILNDARDVASAEDFASAAVSHLRLATNGGRIRSVVTVGPALGGGRDFRILSPQVIRYAGYREVDGSVTGDPANADLTDFCASRGWSSSGGRFDVLPFVISADGGSAQLFDLPSDAVHEVKMFHPRFRWFAKLGLKWHAVPAISNQLLDTGSELYPVVFSGWYVSTEVGARNFSDTDRYNVLPVIADRMGLDRRSERSLWRDEALVVLNQAVIASYVAVGVKIVDHHTVARQFVEHVGREEDAGRKCPTDWSWVNPPMSSSLTPTFHRLYDEPEPDIVPRFVAPQSSSISRCPFRESEAANV